MTQLLLVRAVPFVIGALLTASLSQDKPRLIETIDFYVWCR
jgi:hypothetical protein